MSKKIKKVVLPVGALTLVGAIGALTASQLAYLTDEETALNTFTIGDVKVDVKEPNYPGNNSDEVSHVIPNQEIAKDPQMENTGTDDAVVFAQFSIPVANITLVDAEGNKGTKGLTELFQTISDADSTTALTGSTIAESKINEKWIQIGSVKYVDKEGNVLLKDGSDEAATSIDQLSTADKEKVAKAVYTVGYNTVLGTDDADSASESIFDHVKLVNFIDGEGLENTDMTVGIVGMAIQADNLLNADGTNMDLPDTLNSTTLGTIYNMYFNQNKENDSDTSSNTIVSETGANADVTNEKNIKGNTIITSKLDMSAAFAPTDLAADASEADKTAAIAAAKKLTTGTASTAEITLTTVSNNGAVVPENERDTLSTVKAYLVGDTETELSDEQISISYVKSETDEDGNTTYTITVIPRIVTEDGESIKLVAKSVQGMTGTVEGLTASAGKLTETTAAEDDETGIIDGGDDNESQA
jgi:hypothetical protein